MTDDENNRYHRQMLLFSKVGQDNISKARVTILGLGGLGSHLAQQLAYLGILHYTLVDGETIEPTNLNRFIGAIHEDVGKPKVEVIARMVTSILPDADVAVKQVQVTDKGIQHLVENSSIVLGCFDNDLPRLTVLSKCAELNIPYIDLASDVQVEDDRTFFGGRVISSGIGRGCLFCLGELDQNEIREARLTPAEQRSEKKMYGIDQEVLAQAGPSVVSINGVVASLAVTELMVYLTGLRAPHKFLMYQAGELLGFEKRFGVVKLVNREPAETCPYCFKFGLIKS
jgi:hypothetical protein